MESISGERSNGNKIDKSRRVWSNKEEDALIDALKALCRNGWKSDTGVFKAGYILALEKAMSRALPNTDLRASPHIESKLAFWKRHYTTLASMLARDGFSWNDNGDCISVDNNEALEAFLKDNPKVQDIRHKSFPYYNDWKYIFGKDKISDHIPCTQPQTADEMDEECGNKEHEAGNYVDGSTSVAETQTDHEKDAVKHKPKKTRLSPDLTMGDLSSFSTSLHALTEKIEEGLDMISQRFAYDQELAASKKNLYPALSKLPGLRIEDRLKAADRIARDPHRIDIFFGLPDEDKVKMVEMLLDGRM